MLKYLRDNFNLFIKGTAIGGAVIIPGVSGGTIAFLLGIYDDMIEAIVGIPRHFGRSVAYLFPILFGALLAVLALVFPITWAFDNAPLPLVTLFAGLIIGGLPSLHPSIKGQANLGRMSILISALLLAAGLGIMSVVTSFDATSVLATITVWHLLVVFIVGILGASAMVMPGISGSMLLLVIGFYAPLTDAIRAIMVAVFETGALGSVLVPILFIVVFALGILVGFVLISLLMKFLLARFKTATYFGILGFILGSLIALYYNYEVVDMYIGLPWWHILIAAVLFILGGAASLLLSRYGQKRLKGKS